MQEKKFANKSICLKLRKAKLVKLSFFVCHSSYDTYMYPARTDLERCIWGGPILK